MRAKAYPDDIPGGYVIDLYRLPDHPLETLDLEEARTLYTDLTKILERIHNQQFVEQQSEAW